MKRLVIKTKDLAYDADWKKLQMRVLGAKDITIDRYIKDYIKQNRSWVFDITYANQDIKTFVRNNNIKFDNQHFDFSIICDLEFSKLPLQTIERTIQQKWIQSRQGCYVGLMSYFLNWGNDPLAVRPELAGELYHTIDTWLPKFLGIHNYTNDSHWLKPGIQNVDNQGRLLSGSDFIYTHGNIRLWLWK